MSLRHAVLGMLADAPGSGYDLLKRFESRENNAWSATQSQLYGELGKLAQTGLIEMTVAGPRGRKEYAITEAGRHELREWLLDPVPPQPARNETLLRMYFLGEVEPAQAREYVRRQGAEAEEQAERLDALDEAIPWDDSDRSFYGRLVLEWGKRYAAMQREWADWAEHRIRANRG
ncbi:PadR family transcriptional regulator [Amycolatopsis sulphurea]|uniref:PadR family transcriptional regulator n=1 Tax=Amycolatopsis sulphurea TaxID=76022 RepID=A0A2A9FIL9_9PSEU|nr:PadR family transcriptional regulator [Amycolatopsis sulphurea]PFG50581.1 PadR family transcriptional regulator [Amycolatopsis sulphurea]